jgi:hypothetical protein
MALGLTQPPTEMSARKYFWEVERCKRTRLTTSPPTVSRLSIHYVILDISQFYMPLRPVTGIALRFIYVRTVNVFAPCVLT